MVRLECIIYTIYVIILYYFLDCTSFFKFRAKSTFRKMGVHFVILEQIGKKFRHAEKANLCLYFKLLIHLCTKNWTSYC